jgi:hypothetical protein
MIKYKQQNRMIKIASKSFLLFCVVVMFFVLPKFAQATTGCAGTGACYYYTTTATSNNWSDTTKWFTGSGGTGTYSFLVPPGTYYLKVETSKYAVYQSSSFSAKEGGGVHQNIELKKKPGWLTSLW